MPVIFDLAYFARNNTRLNQLEFYHDDCITDDQSLMLSMALEAGTLNKLLLGNNSDSGSTKLSKGLALTMKAGDVLGDRQSSVIVTVIE